MTILQFKAKSELEEWLEGRPANWGKAVAVRAAMRSLPYLQHAELKVLADITSRTLRALLVSWLAVRTPRTLDSTDASARAAAALDIALRLTQGSGSLSSSLASNSAYLAALAADSAWPQHISQSVKSSAEAAANYVHLEHPDVEDIKHLADFPDDPAGGILQKMWAAVAADCEWLAAQGEKRSASPELIEKPIWLEESASKWTEDWWKLESQLLLVDENFSVWTEWFERQIWGEVPAFEIQRDKSNIEYRTILRRLAEATDEDFWGKGYEFVNAELTGWLEDARERSATRSPWWERTFGPSTLLETINPDPQDGRSPQFGSDASGRIAIRPEAGADQLRSDIQSLSRRARALQMAQRLAEALRNHNNAGYMAEMASNYVAAMEGGPDGPDPSGLVFAGDQLREAIAKHRAAGADDDLQPLPPSADRDASAFLSAHNMYVGSDPFLDDLDRTTRGPDAPLPAANPDEIRRVATIARHDNILAEPTYDYIVAASEAAPANFDPADRHSRFVAGLAQNFARYGIELLWAYPNESAWVSLAAGAAVTIALGPVAAAGGTIAGIGIAYHMARNMIANEAIYEKLLATSPAGEDNFNRLMRFLKSLPIKSLKDD